MIGNIPNMVGGMPGMVGGMPGMGGGMPGMVGNMPGMVGNMPGMGGGMPGMVGNMPGMGGGMPGMGGNMPGMGGNMPGFFPNPVVNNMNQGVNNNANWMSMYNNGQQNPTSPQMGMKINVVFKTTMGVITNLLIDYGKTMSELFKIYLARVDKSELFNTKNTIAFLFNARKLDWLDDTKVEQFFSITPNPTIVVNDLRGLIGA